MRPLNMFETMFSHKLVKGIAAMSFWAETGIGEDLSIVDALDPLRLYLEAALGSIDEADDAICELFENLVLLHPDQQPKTKDDWFRSIDACAIEKSYSSLEREKHALKQDPALYKLFQSSGHDETFFLTIWLNAGIVHGKGRC